MAFRLHLESVIFHNVCALRNAPLTELYGTLGYLCTFLPLMTAMGLRNSIDLSSTMVVFGLANILTGTLFGVPLVLQPMEIIAAVSIGEDRSKEATAAAGLMVSFAILILVGTGTTHWVQRIVPTPVARGIQVGAGFSLAMSAGSLFIQPLGWHTPVFDNKTWAVVAAVSYLAVAVFSPRLPWGAIIYLLGLPLAATQTTASIHHILGFWKPQIVIKPATIELLSVFSIAVPQLPVATLKILSTSATLSTSLSPRFPTYPSSTSLGRLIAFFNLLGCWLGAMPMCFAPYTSAGEHHSSAGSGVGPVVLGGTTLLLGLFIGETIYLVFRCFPTSLLGIMLLATGINVASVGQHASEFAKAQSHMIDRRTGGENNAGDLKDVRRFQIEEERLVMLITATGCLAFQNNALGFIVGLCWCHGSALARFLRTMKPMA